MQRGSKGVRRRSLRYTGGQDLAEFVGEKVGEGLRWIGELGINERIRDEIKVRVPAIERYRRDHPDDGVLIIVYIDEPNVALTPNDPGVRSLWAVYVHEGGRTEDDAINRWETEPKLRRSLPRSRIESERRFVWYPPLRRVRPHDWIGGGWRTPQGDDYMHIGLGPQGEVTVRMWAATGEPYRVNGLWLTRGAASPILDERQVPDVVLTVDFERRSFAARQDLGYGRTSWRSRFRIVTADILVESFEETMASGANRRGERRWEKAR